MSFDIDMHQTTVGKLEAAQRPITLREMTALSLIFDIPLRDLLTSPEPTERLAELREALVAKYDERRANQAAEARAAGEIARKRLDLKQLEKQHEKWGKMVVASESEIALLEAEYEKARAEYEASEARDVEH